MASELNMYETQIGEYKYEIERLGRDLQEVKKKYFMQKKKEQQVKYVQRRTFHQFETTVVHFWLPKMITQPIHLSFEA
jgi:hypothetical protein